MTIPNDPCDGNSGAMREQEIGDAALQTLVRQFANAFDFIRELVQNSLDAGTPTVNVSIDLEKVDDEYGVCKIAVQDYGEGMDEQIIDNRLTRLFSSSKEDDFTNIGKFGIGFVSVFALAPDAVILATSRGGQAWEVFFHPNRTFEKVALDEPLEGTRVTLLKKIKTAVYPNYVAQLQERLSLWCKHAEKEINFIDLQQQNHTASHRRKRQRETKKHAVNEPFRVAGFLPVTVSHENAEIVIAFSHSSFCGFYNRGLTLFEGYSTEAISEYERYLPHVSFKINSPFLEHTLTRDTILKDASYHKAMGLLVEAARIHLVENLVVTQTKLATLPSPTAVERDEYLNCLKWMYKLPRSLDPTFCFGERMSDWGDTVLEKMGFGKSTGSKAPRMGEKSVDAGKLKLFRRCHGAALTMEEIAVHVAKHGRRLYLSPEENDQTKELSEHQLLVLQSPSDAEAYSFFRKHINAFFPDMEIETQPHRAYLFEELSLSSLRRHEKEFIHATLKLLKHAMAPIAEILPVNFLGDIPTEVPLSACMELRNVARCSPQIVSTEKETVVWNVPGAFFQSLAALFRSEPILATIIAARQTIVETVRDDVLRISCLRMCMAEPAD